MVGFQREKPVWYEQREYQGLSRGETNYGNEENRDLAA
jgi:hypothetical protein